MAVTRIKNNQITDSTIIANAKIVPYTVTSTLLANNLNYGSDFTIAGNLTVNGVTTTIDTVNTLIEDPLIVLADGQTSGAPSVDIGYIGLRGSQLNAVFAWRESEGAFVTALSNTSISNTVFNLNQYADFHTANANIGGNIVINGTTSLVGNIIGPVSFSGNITGGNLLTTGIVSATGNVIGGNVTTAGQVSATGNVSGGNLTTAGQVSATSNITGGNVLTSGLISATGNITGGNIISGNAVIGNINVSGDITVNSLNANTTISAAGNITGGNLITSGVVSSTGTVTGGNLATSGTVSATSNITGGNVLTGGIVSSTGNVIGGNLTTTGQVVATSNVSGGNINTAGSVSATGNVIGGNVVTSTVTTSSGDLVLNSAGGALQWDGSGNIVMNSQWINNLSDPVQAQDAATKEYVDNAVSTGITIHTPVYVESPTALNGTYAQGGATYTVNQTIAGDTVVFSTAANLQVNDQLWFSSSFQGIQANVAYFVVSTPNTSAAVLSTTYNGAPVSNITSATGLTQGVRVNSGVGATLTNAGANATLTIDGVTLSNGQRVLIYTQANAVHNGVYVVSEAGNATTAWQLTRTTDTNTYAPESVNALDAGDYFFVQAGDTGAGESYVMTAPIGPFIIGYNNLTFTQFSASQVYSANTQAGLSLTGTVFSAKVDNNTTAFDGSGNIIVKAGANLTTPNIGAATGTSLSVTGNVTGGNITTAGTVDTGTVNATGNITGGNISVTGNVTATNFIGNISGNIDAGGANTDIQFNDNNILNGSSAFTFNKTSNVVTMTGNLIVGNVFAQANLEADGDVAGSNIVAATNLLGVNVSVLGNVLGNVASLAGNITGANLITGGIVTASGNIIGGNLTTTGSVVADGYANIGNIRIVADNIYDTAGRLNINGQAADSDFSVSGLVANVFYIDGGTSTASFGSSTQTTNAIVAFNATNSVLMPVGNTAQRPSVGVTGMVRFNTTANSLELYDNDSWSTVGLPSFTVIADDQFNGDGSTVAFTLSSSQTTNSCIVSINGVVQIPTVAYSVSSTTLTFTEAPQSGDVIDVREITTTTTVTAISNSAGNAVVEVTDANNLVTITGNLVPTANAAQSLGSPTAWWKDIYVSGNTIYLGPLQLKATATTFTVYQSDGTTQANIDAGAIDVSSISSGTSAIGISGTNGNAYITVGGTANVLVASTTGVTVQGTVTGGNLATGGTASATGTITGGNLATGGTASATGNITGGNFNTGGLVSATGAVIAGGNVSGANVNTTGTVSATGNVTSAGITTSGSATLAGINISGNTISSAGSTLTIDPAAPGTTGTVVIAGNLTVTGTTTTIDSTTITTNDLVIQLANNAATSAAANGAGLAIGPTGAEYGKFLYVSTSNVWGTALGISATGTVTGGNIATGGTVSATGAITGASLSVGTGTITGGNIVNSNANGVGNIGSSSTYFNTVFAKATSAQYADLAEKYTADADYEPGTVVMFGGSAEVTICGADACKRVAGVVSTNPSYIMNGGLESDHVVTVALTGRVPTRVTGTVRKGDLMVSAGNGVARAEENPAVGTVIGKALADFDGTDGTIEVVVGRF